MSDLCWRFICSQYAWFLCGFMGCEFLCIYSFITVCVFVQPNWNRFSINALVRLIKSVYTILEHIYSVSIENICKYIIYIIEYIVKRTCAFTIHYTLYKRAYTIICIKNTWRFIYILWPGLIESFHTSTLEAHLWLYWLWCECDLTVGQCTEIECIFRCGCGFVFYLNFNTKTKNNDLCLS